MFVGWKSHEFETSFLRVMNKLPKCYGIIPARYCSVRFPGKPLAHILGKPMFWHVYQRARCCPELARVVLATDDRRIVDAAKALQVPVVMTRRDHRSGTDRVLEAAKSINVEADAVIVNIQGDEPAFEPAMLTELLRPLQRSKVKVATLVREMNTDEAQNPDRVKVAVARDGRALYFSRACIPYRHKDGNPTVYVHIGIYAFRFNILEKFVALDQSPLETAEKLEQLRLLENNIPIHTAVTAHQSIGVDHPEDIPIVARIMSTEHGVVAKSGYPERQS
jgi:3-deoxy-manno-octulosonate cytidylyltransferase (CMP-KDO synthetase)